MDLAVGLREITDENRDSVIALSVAPVQERFVGTVLEALRDAAETPEGNPWFRAIYLGEQPVGFVMLSWDVEPDPPRIIGPWFLWKLIVDQEYQRQGIGGEVVRLIAEIVRSEGAESLLTSYVEGEGSPGGFYERVGFTPTGTRDDNDEVIVVLEMT